MRHFALSGISWDALNVNSACGMVWYVEKIRWEEIVNGFSKQSVRLTLHKLLILLLLSSCSGS